MTAHAQQQKTDTLATANAEGDDRNVMLNAADSYKPREIQIGLPSEDVNVYEVLEVYFDSPVDLMSYVDTLVTDPPFLDLARVALFITQELRPWT